MKRVFLVVGHQKGALMDYLGGGRHFGVDIAYIYQSERKGLGHAILQGKKWITSPFVVLLGDSFIQPKEEIRDIVDVHKTAMPLATLLLFEVDSPEGYGIVRLRSDGSRQVEDLMEKPSPEDAKKLTSGEKHLAITGVYVFDPKIFTYIERTPPGANGEIQITDALHLAIQAGEKVIGVVMKGRYLDMGKWETVLNIEKELAAGADIDAQVRERDNLMKRIKGTE